MMKMDGKPSLFCVLFSSQSKSVRVFVGAPGSPFMTAGGRVYLRTLFFHTNSWLQCLFLSCSLCLVHTFSQPIFQNFQPAQKLVEKRLKAIIMTTPTFEPSHFTGAPTASGVTFQPTLVFLTFLLLSRVSLNKLGKHTLSDYNLYIMS